MPYPLKFQDEVFQTLETLFFSGRFPHALILEGPAGSGKRTAAKYAVSMLLCREAAAAPCGRCRSCRRSLENHPDLATVLPANKSKTISVEQIREVRLAAWVMPHESERKVFFIPEAQRLRTEAQNALLKLIEEPPDSAFFIMTAPSRSGLLETVISRCSVVTMRELDFEERLETLSKMGLALSGEKLSELAACCKTVGEGLLAASDPEASGLAQSAELLLEQLLGGRRYQALLLLSGYEKERERYIKLLSALRFAVLSRLCAKDNSLSALRAGKIIAIIDDVSFAAGQNASLPLLSAAAASRMISAAAAL